MNDGDYDVRLEVIKLLPNIKDQDVFNECVKFTIQED